METALVDCAGCRLAMGFEWSVDGEKKTVKEITSQGSVLGADIIATRGRQFGLGRSDLTDSEPYFEAKAAASWLDPPEQSFVVRLHLKDFKGYDLWWVFARLNGVNIGMGDTVFRDVDSAAACMEDLRRLLPNGSAFENELALDGIEDSEAWIQACLHKPGPLGMLMASGACRKLANYHGMGIFYVEITFIAVLLTGLLVWGAISLKDYLTAKGVTQASRIVENQRRLRREFIKKHPEKVWDTPWVEVQVPEAAGRSCLGMVESTPIAMGGWKWRSSECRFSKGTTTAKAEYSVTAVSTYFGLPKGTVVSPNKPRVMEETRKVKGNPIIGDPLDYTKFFTKKYIETWFLQHGQIHKVKTSIKFRPKEKLTEKNIGTFECPWARGDFTMKNVPTAGLQTALRPLAKLPGVSVRSMKRMGLLWEVKGEIYGK